LEAAFTARGIARRTATVDSLAGEPAAVIADLSDGTRLAAALIVAADGRRSVIRAVVGIETTEWRYDQAALVVNFAHTLPHRDTSTEFHTETGPFTVVPLADQRSSLVWVDHDGECARVNTTLERQKGRNLLACPLASLLVVDPENTGRYLQANGTMAGTVATREATLGTPNGTNTTWSLPPITLPSGGDWRFSATARALTWSANEAGSSTSESSRARVKATRDPASDRPSKNTSPGSTRRGKSTCGGVSEIWQMPRPIDTWRASKAGTSWSRVWSRRSPVTTTSYWRSTGNFRS